MKKFLLLSLVSFSAHGVIGEGRSPPRGADEIRVVSKFLHGDGGQEVHLFENGARPIFRSPSGLLLDLVRIEGPRDCDNLENLTECTLIFSDGEKTVSIKGDSLREGSLFRSVSKGIKSHVSL